MMRTILVSIFYLCSVSRLQGLELSLDFTTPTPSGHRAVCGVLTCEESITADTTNVSTRRTISSLSVFKITQYSPNGVDMTKSAKKILVESLTLTRSKITRVSNGVKVNGVLKAERATLVLEMVKEIDCSAHYSCEVRTSDGQGNEFVQTNRLGQRPEQRESQASGEVSTPVVFFQQLALLQQQMTLLGASLDGKLGALDNKFGDMETRLDNKFGNLETRLDAIKNRAEDKIMLVHDQIETRVVDKLCQLEIKLPGVCGDENAASQRLDEIKESFTTLKNDIKEDTEKALRLNTLVISNSTSEIVTAVQGHMSEIHTCEERNQLRFNNLIAAKDRITNSSEELSHRLQNDFQVLSNSFEELKIGVQNKSTETLSVVRELIADTNTTMWNSLKPVVVDILSPKVCKEGMIPSLLGTAFPYHVIQPTGKSELDVPYLCDSVTEGGGWIVIHRRTSGALNFYRNWDEYKKGFGSLYGEFWLGNENIHVLTNSGSYELRVDVQYKGMTRFAHYGSFSIDGENNNYVLRVGGYDGTAGDSLAVHNGKPFSTHDRDNDGVSHNDAVRFTGAWWYCGGYNSNLNAEWNLKGSVKAARWETFSGGDSVTFSEMKIRKI